MPELRSNQFTLRQIFVVMTIWALLLSALTWENRLGFFALLFIVGNLSIASGFYYRRDWAILLGVGLAYGPTFPGLLLELIGVISSP